MSLSDNLDKADSVQSELLTLAEDLAAELRILPTQRDGAKIRALWKQINAIRPRLSSLHRKLRKQRTSLPTTASRAAKAVHRDQMREIKAIGARLTHWQDMARLVEAHIDPPRHPINLHRAPYPTDGALLHLHRALHRMANRKEQKKDAADHKCFADIAFPIVAFEELVRAAYRLLLIMGRAQSARFLRCGMWGRGQACHRVTLL